MSNDKRNYFDDQQKKSMLEWLERKWPIDKRACEICGISNWSLAEDLIAPMPFIGGSISLGGNSYPQAMVICTNCGNTKYFNAVISGIVKGEKNGK